MADAKLSALSALTPLADGDLVYAVRSGTSYKTTVATLRAAVGGIEGNATNYAALPVTVGTPAVGTRYIVDEDQGSYFTFNKFPAGLYQRTANNGVGADWVRLGDFTLVPFRDDQAFYDNVDGTKTLKFQLSGITTSTERVATWPDKDGTVAMTNDTIALSQMANLAQDQFIGRTTASTGIPETATITAAARTVLDDTTVGAMVNTLGGAAAVGTGGLAREGSPTFSGTTTFSGGAAVLDISSGDGTLSASGGGQLNITAKIQLDGIVLDTAGADGAAGQTLKTDGSGNLTYSNDLGCYTMMLGGTSIATLAQNSTWYTGWLIGGSPAQVNQGRYKTYIPKTGTIKSFTFHLYGAGGEAAKNLTVDLWLNNSTSIGSGTIASNAFPGQYTATALSQAVTGWNGSTGDYIELRVASPATMTSITNGAYIALVYIETAQ